GAVDGLPGRSGRDPRAGRQPALQPHALSDLRRGAPLGRAVATRRAAPRGPAATSAEVSNDSSTRRRGSTTVHIRADRRYPRTVPTSKAERTSIEVDGREVVISNPGKVYFPEAGITKLEVVRYYLAVAEGALRGAGGRPNVLVRYADGIHGEFFYQKRAPTSRPPWIEVVALRFPSGRIADE